MSYKWQKCNHIHAWALISWKKLLYFTFLSHFQWQHYHFSSRNCGPIFDSLSFPLTSLKGLSFLYSKSFLIHQESFWSLWSLSYPVCFFLVSEFCGYHYIFLNLSKFFSLNWCFPLCSVFSSVYVCYIFFHGSVFSLMFDDPWYLSLFKKERLGTNMMSLFCCVNNSVQYFVHFSRHLLRTLHLRLTHINWQLIFRVSK